MKPHWSNLKKHQWYSCGGGGIRWTSLRETSFFLNRINAAWILSHLLDCGIKARIVHRRIKGVDYYAIKKGLKKCDGSR